MIITCPNCGTQYRLDAGSLGELGRSVKCARCTHRWFVGVERPPIAALAPPPAEPVPDEPPPLHPPPTARAPARRSPVGWLVLALVVLALTAGVFGRDEIAGTFPQTAVIYQRLGLPVTLAIGLELRNVVTARPPAADGALVVTGEIHNVAGQPRLVPAVRIGLLDEARHEVASQMFEPPDKVLPSTGSTRFEARFAAPPAEARNVVVTFDDTP